MFTIIGTTFIISITLYSVNLLRQGLIDNYGIALISCLPNVLLVSSVFHNFNIKGLETLFFSIIYFEIIIFILIIMLKLFNTDIKHFLLNYKTKRYVLALATFFIFGIVFIEKVDFFI